MINDAYSRKFCFLKNKENGKIPIVFHPPDERSDVVHVKKSIVSTFQVNLKQTDEEEETDAQSHHISRYRYTSGKNFLNKNIAMQGLTWQ